jgi:hypothetical protein
MLLRDSERDHGGQARDRDLVASARLSDLLALEIPPVWWGIASIDLFVTRTISFKLLYGTVILGHARRR